MKPFINSSRRGWIMFCIFETLGFISLVANIVGAVAAVLYILIKEVPKYYRPNDDHAFLLMIALLVVFFSHAFVTWLSYRRRIENEPFALAEGILVLLNLAEIIISLGGGYILLIFPFATSLLAIGFGAASATCSEIGRELSRFEFMIAATKSNPNQ